MSKKKNSQKKHTFKHVSTTESDTTATVSSVPVATAATAAPLRTAAAGMATTTQRDFSYVAGDMRRIGVAAALLVTLELGLYYVLTQTPVGTAVYSLVKV